MSRLLPLISQNTEQVCLLRLAGDDQELADFYASQQPSTSGSGRPQFKQGTPSDYELERISSGLGDAWKKLGRRLKIQDPKLDDLNKLNEDFSEKGYKMLKHWKEVNGSAATYQILGDGLQMNLVNRRDLAEEFCYKKQ
nr:uncharacterized protein LOC131783924 [Pocillopora verrucosa]